MRYKNITGRFFGLVTKHECDRRTDGRTDGQNYDSQDRASIAASRGKNQCSSEETVWVNNPCSQSCMESNSKSKNLKVKAVEYCFNRRR